jgi:hypothetical protein
VPATVPPFVIERGQRVAEAAGGEEVRDRVHADHDVGVGGVERAAGEAGAALEDVDPAVDVGAERLADDEIVAGGRRPADRGDREAEAAELGGALDDDVGDVADAVGAAEVDQHRAGAVGRGVGAVRADREIEEVVVVELAARQIEAEVGAERAGHRR